MGGVRGKWASRRRDRGTSNKFCCSEKQQKNRYDAPNHRPRRHGWSHYHAIAAGWQCAFLMAEETVHWRRHVRSRAAYALPDNLVQRAHRSIVDIIEIHLQGF